MWVSNGFYPFPFTNPCLPICKKKTIHGLFFLPNISGPPSLVVLLGLRLAPAQRLHCTSVRRMGRGGAFLARAQRAEVQQSQPAIGVA